MITQVDRTPVSPTTGDSLGHVGYKDLGPRPACADCGAIDECPECSVDIAYKVPVVAGDLVYFQFNLADNYNENPESPTAGWYTGSPTGLEYYIEATLEFGSLEPLPLPSGSIIRSQNVGYEGGSYQNLILNSAEIYEHIQAQGATSDCWRVQITTYRLDRGPVKVIFVFASSFGTLPSSGVPANAYGVVDDQLYQYVNGAWVGISTFEVGAVVQLSKNGQYYQWNGSSWDIVDPSTTKEEDQECFTAWHKFVLCDNTVLVEGVFGFKDCTSRYYGISEGEAEQGLLAYRDRYRVEASLEMNGITTEKTTNENNVVTEFSQYEQWIFRNTAPLPNQVIRRIANTLTAAHYFFDVNEYVNASDLTKLNADGLYWYTSIGLERLLCEKPNTCDDILVFNPIVICEDPETITCEDVTIINSDDTVIGTATSGSTFVLPDTTLRVYLDEVLEQTVTFATLSDVTINVNWN